MADPVTASPSQILKEDDSRLGFGNHATLVGEWNNGDPTKKEDYAVVMLLKAFLTAEGGFLTLAEISKINTPDNVPLMMLSLG
jgi:hypothetical protein